MAGLEKHFTHMHECLLLLPSNIIKLSSAWYLSEQACVCFLEGDGVILMQLEKHNML